MNTNEPFAVPNAAVRLLVVLAAVQLIREVLAPDLDALMVYYMGFSVFRQGIFDPVWLYGSITHVLIHSGWWHLLANAAWIIIVSPQVFPHLPGMRLILFFALTGAAGALCHACINWGTAGILVGASGAVFGLLGAGAYVMIRGRDGSSRPTGKDILQYVLLIMIVNVGYAAFGGGTVSWEAHAGGFFAGLVLFPVIRHRLPGWGNSP